MSFGINRVELTGRLGADVTFNHLASGVLFPGLFRGTGALISRTDRSLPEGGQGAGVSDGRRRVKPLRGSSASLRPFG